MSIGFIEEKDGTRIGIHIGEEKERLLESPPGGRQIQRDAPFSVGHCDLATLRNISRDIQIYTKEQLDMGYQLFPYLVVFAMNPMAQIS